MKTRLVAAMLCGIALQAQKPNPPAAPQVLKQETFVRRISAGATLTVLGLRMIPDRTVGSVTTQPPVNSLYSTKGATQRIGYGAMVQAAITNRFAVNASVFLRRTGYVLDTSIIEGTETTVETRKHEDTRVRLYDVPVVVRFYTKNRHKPGPRFFVEGGGALRQVSHIRTTVSTTVGTNPTTYDSTAATPAHRTVRGFIGGAGLQLIDPLGIRVVPEVRYTRWTGLTFNSFSTVTRRDQVEANLSFTF